MLDRNRQIKPAPERWQDQTNLFDVIITCEERCFDAVCDGPSLPPRTLPLKRVYVLMVDLLSRPVSAESALPVHVINVDIKDNQEEALLGGQAILKLVEMLEAVDDVEFDGRVEDVLVEWMKGPGQRYPVLHTVGWL